MGKVHGSLARAGKVKSQTPKVEPQEKKKTPKGRAKKRLQYTRRFVNVTLTGGKRKVSRISRFHQSVLNTRKDEPEPTWKVRISNISSFNHATACTFENTGWNHICPQTAFDQHYIITNSHRRSYGQASIKGFCITLYSIRI